MRTPIINITIPVFNRPALTLKTILAVRKHTLLPHILTVVDNGSEKETQNLLINLKKQNLIDHLFRLKKNYGISVAANVGWRAVPAPLYMKLDNDIVIHSKEWLPFVLAQMAKRERDAVWGADLNGQMDKPEFVRNPQGLIGQCFTHISGGAIIIPRSIAKFAGYWCEDYGLYGVEDGDYGTRLGILLIEQFYFSHKLFMSHCGHDGEELKDQHSLDKNREKRINLALFQANYFLYTQGHRPLNLPPVHIPLNYDGYELTMEYNGAYKEIYNKFMDFYKTITTDPQSAQKGASAVDELISSQNKLWEAALQTGEDAYAGLRRQLFGRPASTAKIRNCIKEKKEPSLERY